MPDPHLRASDADRSAVADVLGTHMSAGRLTVAEYDERLTRAYAARTYGELDELTADLPASPAPSAGAVGASAPAAGGTSSGAHRTSHPAPSTYGLVPGSWWSHGVCGSRAGHAAWGQWLTTAVLVTAIWLVSSLGSGEWIYPWPIWVVGPWGVVLLVQSRNSRGRDHGPARLDTVTTATRTTDNGTTTADRSPERMPR